VQLIGVGRCARRGQADLCCSGSLRTSSINSSPLVGSTDPTKTTLNPRQRGISRGRATMVPTISPSAVYLSEWRNQSVALPSPSSPRGKPKTSSSTAATSSKPSPAATAAARAVRQLKVRHQGDRRHPNRGPGDPTASRHREQDRGLKRPHIPRPARLELSAFGANLP
jgi:hypothetical protein